MLDLEKKLVIHEQSVTGGDSSTINFSFHCSEETFKEIHKELIFNKLISKKNYYCLSGQEHEAQHYILSVDIDDFDELVNIFWYKFNRLGALRTNNHFLHFDTQGETLSKAFEEALKKEFSELKFLELKEPKQHSPYSNLYKLGLFSATIVGAAAIGLAVRNGKFSFSLS